MAGSGLRGGDRGDDPGTADAGRYNRQDAIISYAYGAGSGLDDTMRAAAAAGFPRVVFAAISRASCCTTRGPGAYPAGCGFAHLQYHVPGLARARFASYSREAGSALSRGDVELVVYLFAQLVASDRAGAGVPQVKLSFTDALRVPGWAARRYLCFFAGLFRCRDLSLLCHPAAARYPSL